MGHAYSGKIDIKRVDPIVRGWATDEKAARVKFALEQLSLHDFTMEYQSSAAKFSAAKQGIQEEEVEDLEDVEKGIRGNLRIIYEYYELDSKEHLKFAHNLVVWLDKRRTELLEEKKKTEIDSKIGQI